MSPAPEHVKFGVVVHQEALGRDLRQAVADQLAMVHAVRDLGWDGVWSGQHFLTTGLSILQPIPLLARLIPETGDMDIGIGILLLALYSPVDVAETFASLDVLSGGRLILGLGLGYRDEEYAAFGIRREQRVERFERNLELLARLWTGEEVDADLPWCRLERARLTTLPLQRPRPPIWIAANSDRAVERAARLGDTWMVNPHARIDTLSRQIDLFLATREAAHLNRPRDLPIIREIFCARDRATAIELAGPYLNAKYRTYSGWGQDKVLADEDAFQHSFEELREQRFVLGSPAECLAQLQWWRDRFGVNYFVLRTHWAGMPLETALSSIRLLSAEVFPALRG
ncbi:MAG TPA: LLM class flavin-dependent oxidoreductase [Chloroflexota bacterium]|nr:LLM class flavin-dependent oxidoreductase [Chloroflexota bacterium]